MEERKFDSYKRIKVKPNEKIILETEDGFIVNADSSYGYSIGDKELVITCSKK